MWGFSTKDSLRVVRDVEATLSADDFEKKSLLVKLPEEGTVTEEDLDLKEDLEERELRRFDETTSVLRFDLHMGEHSRESEIRILD